MSLINWIDFQSRDDERGSLVVVEVGQGKPIPFGINRVYYVYGASPSISRGFHAHRTLKQVAIPVIGSCRMVLDDGHEREDVWLNNPKKGLLLDTMMWHEMHDFSNNCLLLVLASEHYDEGDYIRDYEKFLSLVKR
jgi:dTDP-4-dehydrorhamnose 3,5-epimerase-like enzyme